ncbi:MAG TPA: tRNA guanosine(34) transglycosylase Tgt, partial [bacterium]|nr:tRNA guanosine(34) transglycosylase Tgt [bacterium]
MFKYKIRKKSNFSSLRTGVISTTHGEINTPVFMPVGTVGAVKSVAPWELRELGAEIILGNTYHLYLRPGEKLIEEFGGLAKFNRWEGPILTDSGGFQVFSLGSKSKVKSQKPKAQGGNQFKQTSLVKIAEDGVEFKSHLDGKKHYFTPEKVVDIQIALGSDIIMPLDVCPPSKAKKAEVERAVDLSIKWLRRSKLHLDRKFET